MSQLNSQQPHGTHSRYNGGCRCADCKRGHAAYCRRRAHDRRRGNSNGITDAARAREHIRKLARAGVGYRAIADSTDITPRVILGIKSGRRLRARAQTIRKILAVTVDCRADRALVSAASTWRRIEKLREEGFTKRGLARLLGYRSPGLQFRRARVTFRTRARVERLFEKLTT